eukprot:30965-Pelagococcus_subviridis.AAC.9
MCCSSSPRAWVLLASSQVTQGGAKQNLRHHVEDVLGDVLARDLPQRQRGFSQVDRPKIHGQPLRDRVLQPAQRVQRGRQRLRLPLIRHPRRALHVDVPAADHLRERALEIVDAVASRRGERHRRRERAVLHARR